MNTILDAIQLQDTVQKLAMAIAECWLTAKKARGVTLELALVGIRSRGGPLADRLAELIMSQTGSKIKKGVLDITLYRDDLSRQRGRAIVKSTAIDFNVDGMLIVIVDDVLFTGRTIRAAMDAIFDLGRPELLKLAVLVDRGGRELPIQADFIGLNQKVNPGELVSVFLKEQDGVDQVLLESMKHEV